MQLWKDFRRGAYGHPGWLPAIMMSVLCWLVWIESDRGLLSVLMPVGIMLLLLGIVIATSIERGRDLRD